VNSLGAGLLVRYGPHPQNCGLLHAITIFRQAGDLSPETAIDRPLYLDALGSGFTHLYLADRHFLVYLRIPFWSCGRLSSSTPKDHLTGPPLNNLGTAFRPGTMRQMASRPATAGARSI